MRRPRSSSGTGVGSSGTGLSYAPPGGVDDLADLAHCALDIVVGHDVLVLRCVLHLALGDLAPRRQVLGRLAAALLLAMLELLLGRSHDEDEHRVRNQLPHLLGALDVDLQQDITSVIARALDAVAERAVQVAVVVRMLEKSALSYQLLELLSREEGVVLVRLFSRARLPGRARHRVRQPLVELQQSPDQRVLAYAGRTGDDDEQPSLHATDAQKSSKSRGGGASKLISRPVRGWRRRSRQAWSMGRCKPGSRPPYSASPATGWPNAARWTRIWCVRPVSRSQR